MTSELPETIDRAQAELMALCPIVTGLLAFDDRLMSEVRAELQRPSRPPSPGARGLQFATRLASDPDPWISWAAQVDAGTLADPSCPGDPMRAILLITSGTDPRVS